MSKPDLDTIIQSPEAETFLGMVTKGFYSNSYTGLWMYEVIGREWDEMRGWAEELQNETKKMLEDKEAWKECVQKKESFSTLENRGMKLMKVK